MENKFPYKGNLVTVSKDMCDMNGHMNVAFYSKIFDEGSGSLYQDLGFSWDCLLYTSPSPRDDISSRMPSSA